MLSALTFLPLIAGLILLLLPRERERLAAPLALGSSLVVLFGTLVVAVTCHQAGPGMHHVEFFRWIPALGIHYFLGVDGLGAVALLLSALVFPMAIVAAWNRSQQPRLYFVLLLLLQTTVTGVFTALNLYHWFLYFEISLVPAFFLIKIYGGPHRSYAAYKFFLYTLLGSVPMLLAFVFIYTRTGTLDLVSPVDGVSGLAGLFFQDRLVGEGGHLLGRATLFVFLAILIGLAVKTPLMPFHSWLPDAYTQAPPFVTMVLTGVMSKMGVYGFLRILMPLFAPELAAAAGWLSWLAAATVFLGMLIAWCKKDLLEIAAYSSLSHVALCVLALCCLNDVHRGPAHFAAAYQGAVMQLFNHGLTAAALFFVFGLLIARNGGRAGIDDFGGLRTVAPQLSSLAMLVIFAGIGLPGLSGFVSEFLIFKAALAAHPGAGALALASLLPGGLVFLRLIQKVFCGPVNPACAAMADLSLREWIVLGPVALLLVVLGVWPQWILNLMRTF